MTVAKMSISSYCHRLVDYFFVVGIENCPGDYTMTMSQSQSVINSACSQEEGESSLSAIVLDRYPENDLDDFPFPNGVPAFCFPTGYSLVSKPTTILAFHEFVCTSDNGVNVYGYALTVYEEFDSQDPNSSFNTSTTSNPEPNLANDAANHDQQYAPKCICIFSHWPFRDQFRSFLLNLYRISVSEITQPLERIISNFVSEVPLPPVHARVQYSIGHSDLYFFRPPLNNLMNCQDSALRLVFECLDVQNLLKSLTATITEKQIVICSSQYTLLSACGETLRALIYPFTWSHCYIPLLPIGMFMVFQAPVPYLVGVHKSTLQAAINAGFSFPSSALVIDIDENLVTIGSECDLISLPRKMHDMLRFQIAECAPVFANRSETWLETVLPLIDTQSLCFTQPEEEYDIVESHAEFIANSYCDADTRSNLSKKNKNLKEDYNWPLVRSFFFRFVLSLLGEFRNYLTYPVHKPVEGKKKSDNQKRSNIRTWKELELESGSFDATSFLEKRKQADERIFLAVLVRTRNFQQFIDEFLHPNGIRDDDIHFVEQSLSVKSNRGGFFRRIFGKVEGPHQSNQSFVNLKTLVCLGPDTSPVPLPNEVWMPGGSKSGTGYSHFPKLIPILFGKIRRLPDSQLDQVKSTTPIYAKARHPALGAKIEDYQWDNHNSGSVFRNAADVIYTAWFSLFTASLGRSTQYSTIEERQGRRRSLITNTSPLGNQSMQLSPVPVDHPKNVESPSFSSDLSGGINKNWGVQLHTAFQVLDVAQQLVQNLNKSVYRSLIEACGRCGHTDYAICVLGIMHDAGIKVDSSIYSNVVQSFSMNGDVRYSLKLDVLRWDNLFPEVQAASQRIKKSQVILNLKEGKENENAFMSPQGLNEPPSQNNKDPCLYTPKNHILESFRYWGEGVSDRQKISNLGSSHVESPGIKSTTGQDKKSGQHRLLRRIFSFQKTNNISTSELKVEVKRGKALSEDASSSNRPVKCGLLDNVFPGLMVDTENESCPKCFRRLSGDEIRRGWNAHDPNDYTTVCPYCHHHFVAYFAIFSSDETWMGSSGLGSRLFVQFLSPWAFGKEVENVLKNLDIHFVCSDAFRKEKNTLFWNIVLYFFEFNLPMEFITGPVQVFDTIL